jgi:hypothetical protein
LEKDHREREHPKAKSYRGEMGNNSIRGGKKLVSGFGGVVFAGSGT